MGQTQLGMGRGFFAQGIEMRLEVPVRTVGVDVTDDLGLLVGVHARGRGRRARNARPAGMTEGEALEKGAPGGIDRVGVLEPTRIGGINQLGVVASGEGDGFHGGF